MWSPIEMFASVKLRIRLSTISPPMPDCIAPIAARAQLDDRGAHQPEDRPRGPEAGRGGGEHNAEGAGEQRGEVDRREAERADRRLEQHAEQIQQVHVEADVQEVLVQEGARDAGASTGAFGDAGAIQHAFVDDRAVDVEPLIVNCPCSVKKAITLIAISA